MEEAARLATTADITELVSLARVGRDAIRDARGGAMWLARQAPPGPLPDMFEAAITEPESAVHLGCIDDVPLGFILARIADGEPRIAVVEELFVLPEARGVGLGEHMMNATIDWAAANSCSGVDGYALPGDRATKNFFETFGLVARGIVVHRRIGDE